MRLFDLHCDTITECSEQKKDLWRNDLQLSLEKGHCFHPWSQCFAVWMPDGLRGKEAVDYFRKCCSYFESQLEIHQEHVALCRTAEQIRAAHQAHKCAAVLTVEGSAAAGGTVDGVDMLYARGVRMMTLTWNGKCEFADGVLVPYAGGLTALGKRAVRRCNDLGLIVDVSHIAPPGFWDVVKFSRKPFVASHSNSKAVHDHPRNLTDEQFQAIVQRKGLVGINLYPEFVRGGQDASVDEIIRHIDHFLNLGGEKTIAVGTDFDGAKMPSAIPDIGKLPRLRERMCALGYSQKLIDAIFYWNAACFFENALTEE